MYACADMTMSVAFLSHATAPSLAGCEIFDLACYNASMLDLLHTIIDFLVATIGAWGYTGIILLMFLESSFFPFPSEIVIIPAGYLAFQGEMNMALVILAGIVGSIGGALFNYWLAAHFGRALLERFISSHKLDRMDAFFAQHGEVSTFTGRMIPVFRQYISFPAGLAQMRILPFVGYTAAGAALWIIVLALIGYFLGSNEALISKYVQGATVGALILVAVIVVIYILWQRKQKQN